VGELEVDEAVAGGGIMQVEEVIGSFIAVTRSVESLREEELIATLVGTFRVVGERRTEGDDGLFGLVMTEFGATTCGPAKSEVCTMRLEGFEEEERDAKKGNSGAEQREKGERIVDDQAASAAGGIRNSLFHAVWRPARGEIWPLSCLMRIGALGEPSLTG
jgi:hypothetical protein